MILLLHICTALASLAYTTYLYLQPSRRKLQVSYSLIAGTLLSGTYLVASTQAHLLQACVTGLFYLAAVAVGIAAAQHKLAAQKIKD